ncbi:MAG TPA: helix-turn-helix transcriptional regulator [Herpetosiphonaceae bacterium]
MDREQQLIDAAMRYQTLLDQGQPVSVRDFVAGEASELREKLAAYLELLLITNVPEEPIVLTADEQALANRVVERARARLREQIAPTAPPPSLTALRKAARLTLGQVARQIDLPVDLLQRIERGGVIAATIPHKLVTRLAQVFQLAEAEVKSALQGSHLRTADLRLSAQDGTNVPQEQAVDFAAALAASTATDAQNVEWG